MIGLGSDNQYKLICDFIPLVDADWCPLPNEKPLVSTTSSGGLGRSTSIERAQGKKGLSLGTGQAGALLLNNIIAAWQISQFLSLYRLADSHPELGDKLNLDIKEEGLEHGDLLVGG